MQAKRQTGSSRQVRHSIWPEYKDDPLGFFVNVLGWLPWSKQREIARDVAEHPYVAVATATGVGKTALIARLVLWWMNTREDAVAITSATTWAQVRSQLWRELRSAHEESMVKLPGKPGVTEFSLGPKWFATGISSKVPESVAGFHARSKLDIRELLRIDNPDGFELDEESIARLETVKQVESPVLVALDEASGIEDPLWEAFDGLLTNPGSRLVATANPTRIAGRFHRIFHPPRDIKGEWPWRTHHIAASDAPEALIDGDWIRRMRIECGPNPERNPRYQVRVLGLFPSSSDRYLYPLPLLELASAGVVSHAPRGRHIGFDVARQGGDACVAVLLVDGRVASVSSWHPDTNDGKSLGTSAKRLLRLMLEWKVEAANVHVDVTGGWGWGVHDWLYERDHATDPVDFGAGPLDDWRWVLGPAPRLATRRQELHWILLRCLQERIVSIPDPGAPGMQRYGPIWTDLTEIEHSYTGKEGFWVESKDQYKARVQRSPDFSDALLCALSRAEPQSVRLGVI